MVPRVLFLTARNSCQGTPTFTPKLIQYRSRVTVSGCRWLVTDDRLAAVESGRLEGRSSRAPGPAQFMDTHLPAPRTRPVVRGAYRRLERDVRREPALGRALVPTGEQTESARPSGDGSPLCVPPCSPCLCGQSLPPDADATTTSNPSRYNEAVMTTPIDSVDDAVSRTVVDLGWDDRGNR